MLKNYVLRYLLFSIVMFGIGSSCNIINPKEPVPTYVHIDSFRFNGVGSSDIKAIWVYYRNNPVGVFDLPATFPVVANGSGSFTVMPAIAINGQNTYMTIYPYYIPDTSVLVANPGKVVNYTPSTKFYSGVTSQTISTFESGAAFSKYSGTASITDDGTDSLSFGTGRVGRIALSNVGDSSIDSSWIKLIVPTSSQYAFVELDYNSTIPFYLGLGSNLSKVISSDPFFITGVNPNGKWQKFYLNIHGITSQYTGDNYTLYIKAVLAPGQTSGRLLVDNIKLVTF